MQYRGSVKPNASRRFFLSLLLAAIALSAQSPNPWTAQDLLPASDLAAKLQKGGKPLVVYVGPAHLFRVKHIPSSVNTGLASRPEGIEALLAQVKGKPADTEIIVYCGCCPMDRCPNIRPAFKALREAGFQKVRILELPTRFADDWTAKGYPAEAGQ